MNILGGGRRSHRPGIAKSLFTIGLTCVWLTTSTMLAGSGSGTPHGLSGISHQCSDGGTVDIAFVIDASGSLANKNDTNVYKDRGRGETYNTEIEGVARALCNRSVIPRDGSVAAAVFTFADLPKVVTLGPGADILLQIESDAAAEGAVSSVRLLTCNDPSSANAPCPARNTDFDGAIDAAANLLLNSHRPGARLVIVMLTDGDPTPPHDGIKGSGAFAGKAQAAGLQAELDVVLFGLDQMPHDPPADPSQPGISELLVNKQKVDPIVFPQPATDLPGATLVVDSGSCNVPDQTMFVSNCEDQADQFAEYIRQILRNLSVLPLMVTTENDPEPGTILQEGQPLSLRQAIEMANCRGGAATITFRHGVSTIRLTAPLPALEEPGIVIDVCATSPFQGASQTAAPCSPSVTIDGGIGLMNGIVIRSEHDSVRNLTLANFFNAGIMVQDTPATLGCLSVHDVGNTLSQNNFSNVRLPIDLEGETQDLGDMDDGPNRALNFPDHLDVSATMNPFSLMASGMVSGAKVKQGATIEIYGITTSSSILASTPTQVFTFLAQTPVLVQMDSQGGFSGVFSVTFPIQAGTQFTGFSATVTDAAGDTSEMGPLCFPQASLDVSNLEFGPLTAEGEIKKNGVADGLFTVMIILC
jgi:hypothetical protein